MTLWLHCGVWFPSCFPDFHDFLSFPVFINFLVFPVLSLNFGSVYNPCRNQTGVGQLNNLTPDYGVVWDCPRICLLINALTVLMICGYCFLAVGPLIGFILCLFLLAALMSYAMLKIGAMAVNLNLLSSDFFALLVGLFVFHYKVSVSAFLMCVLVMELLCLR